MNITSRLLMGSLIISSIICLGLWINSQVNSNVALIDSQPARTYERLEESVGQVDAITTIDYNQYVSTKPTRQSNYSYKWSEISQPEAYDMSQLVLGELNEYNQSYLKNIGLKKIYLVSELKTLSDKPVLGFTDPLKGEVYLNTLKVSGEESRAVVAEQTVHHELAHLLAYSRYGYWFERDGNWPSSPGSYDRNTNLSLNEYFPKTGFATRYSLISASEDFAEVYSLIYTEYFQELLANKVDDDELLNSKLRYVYDTLAVTDLDQCLQGPILLENVCDQ